MSKKQKKQVKQSKQARLGGPIGIVQSLPLIFFTAVVIMLVRAVAYTRPMSQFYWWASADSMTDFFSYCKMTAIIACAAVAVLFILYRALTRTFEIKSSFAYIPMAVYSAFVILSYVFSEYKDFSLLGFPERFEGTLVLLSYMVMLFYAINSVNSEKNVKYVLYTAAAASGLLGLIGVSQAAGHDFFSTQLGRMLIVPPGLRETLGNLRFNFSDNQIYQTVYNINYVSFYLTLLLPVFGLLFLRLVIRGKQEPLYKKIIWGLLFLLLLFNMIGSASSGGYLGMGVAVIAAIALLNKRLLSWWKPIAVLLVMTVIIGAATQGRWLPELKSAMSPMDLATPAHRIDFMEVDSAANTISISIDGNEAALTLYPDIWPAIKISDADGNKIGIKESDSGDGRYFLDDPRFSMCSFSGTIDDGSRPYLTLFTDDQEWDFVATENGTFYINALGKQTNLRKVEAIGFKNDQGFGSGRGYIWSRTLPLMRDTIVIGRGADTFSIYFPQNDYVGKYDAGWPNPVAIIDKPHNMYMQMAVGTGGVSLFAFIALLVFYFAQSVRLYWGRKYSGFMEFAGFGIFLGILGFAATGFVNDSSVSVTPMFYGLLGVGMAINMMIKKAPDSYK